MSIQAPNDPRCNVHVDDADQCGDEAVAKETLREEGSKSTSGTTRTTSTSPTTLSRCENAENAGTYTLSGRTTDMADSHKAVLVPERHRDAVEKYVRDLEALDELRDGDHTKLRN